MGTSNDSASGDRWQRTWDLFHEVLELDPDERSAFLDSSCKDDPEMRAEVDRLLGVHRRSSGILNAGPVDGGTVTFGWAESLVDRRIGSYHLREVVGEGGMGVVYSAEQSEPVRRRVALKLVRPGMASREVLARFESERQALAILDHPRIAKVYDAGVADDGRPYFVMEYVPGIPITEYCDLRGLDLRDRLELFSQACEAIEHAHGRGIIHRDIKPSNLLVAAVDGKPSLKVIDFGVAKAMNQRLTERTLFTRQGVLVGTPGYMSPEQAGTTPLEVDARTDIYALGVVLYELLVGAQPFDPKTLRNVAIAEMLRIIREEDPPTPCKKFTSLGAQAAEVAKRRDLDVQTLMRQIRGELEWITMRALEKDAARRYGSAAELASDIQRHLANEPVAAGPPTVSYRLGKFLRRHRAAVVAAAVVTVVLVGLGGLLGVQSRRLARALDDPLSASGAGGGVVLREVWPDAKDILGSPSPDGRFVSFTDWESGDLALHDFQSGEDRRLTGKGSWTSEEYAESSVISPDGETIAYSWFGPGRYYELRLFSITTAETRVLYGQADTPWLQPVGWSADGTRILTWCARETGTNDLALIDADDGESRVVLSTLESEHPGGTVLSPDARYVLYSRRQKEDSEHRDIVVRHVEHGRDVPIVVHPANDIPMGWSPDGRHVLFGSDRTGNWGLWALEVDDRGARGEPELIKTALGGVSGRLYPMGFTSRGTFLYGARTPHTDVYVTSFDRLRGPESAHKTTELFEGTNELPDWSRDGERLAWISLRPNALTLVIASAGGGDLVEVPISADLLAIEGSGIRWSPDGTSILVSGRSRKTDSWQGIFTIDVATGEAESIAEASPRGILRRHDWSPDGKTVYFLRRHNDESAIVALDLATGRESRVHEAAVGNMALSPDGKWIAYTTDAFVPTESGRTPNLSVVSTSGGPSRRIFDSTPDRPFDPFTPLAWTPDGNHLVFSESSQLTGGQDDPVELLRVSVADGTVEHIGFGPGRLRHLRIHPDGERLAFDARRARYDVWAVENLLPQLDGTRQDG